MIECNGASRPYSTKTLADGLLKFEHIDPEAMEVLAQLDNARLDEIALVVLGYHWWTIIVRLIDD